MRWLNNFKKSPPWMRGCAYQGMHWCQWRHAVLFGCWWWHRCQTGTRPAPVAMTWTAFWWHHHWVAETLPLNSLSEVNMKYQNKLANKVICTVNVTWGIGQWHFGRTVVKSEDDSGLETLWLLKKIAFLSEKETEEKRWGWFTELWLYSTSLRSAVIYRHFSS